MMSQIAGDSYLRSELRLAYGLHLFRPAEAVLGMALHIHRANELVSAVEVLGEFIEQIGTALFARSLRQGCRQLIPQVMMGIDDGQRRLHDLLRREPGKPRLVGK